MRLKLLYRFDMTQGLLLCVLELFKGRFCFSDAGFFSRRSGLGGCGSGHEFVDRSLVTIEAKAVTRSATPDPYLTTSLGKSRFCQALD